MKMRFSRGIQRKRALDAIARAINPLHRQTFTPWPQTYYWSAYQTEWTPDLLFKTPQALAGLYPALVRHALTHFASPDVMRFLGRKAHGNFTGALTSSFKDRPEGVRVKHSVHGNFIKMYNKASRVPRVETTIAKTADFKVFRPDIALLTAGSRGEFATASFCNRERRRLLAPPGAAAPSRPAG